jgi:hypothetical protein
MTRKRKKPIHPLFPRPSPREHFEAWGFSLAAALALFSGTWGKALFCRDLAQWTYPGIFFLKQSLLGGEMPLWSPYFQLGYPFLAELANAAVLYPLSLVYLPFSIPTAMKIYPAVHYVFAGYLMWRLLREWGLSHRSGIFGALVWMASGYLVCLHLTFNYLNAAFYPGLLFCFHRLLLTRRIKWLLLTSLCWALFFLGGDPQGFLFAGVLLVFYAGLGLPRPKQSVRNDLALIPLAGVLTFLLILAQALPSLELGASTTKLGGFDFDKATLWSHHPWRLLEWIWPELWGPAFPPENFWGRFLRLFTDGPWAGAVYLGLFPLVLALAQLRSWREKPLGFLVLTLAVFFLLALGYYSPLYRLVWAVFPPYRIFRYPEKHLVLAVFALAALAAFGFQRHVEKGPEITAPPWLRIWIILTAGLLAVFLILLISAPVLSAGIADLLRQNYQFTIEPSVIRRSLLHATGRSFAVALAFLMLFLLAKRFAGVKRELALILIILTAGDLLQLGRAQLIGVAPSFYAFEPAAGRIIREAQAGLSEKLRFFRAKNFPAPAQLPYSPALSESQQVVYWQKDTLVPNFALPEGLESFFGNDPAELTRFRLFRRRPPRLLTQQMLNVKYFLDGLVKGELQGLNNLRAVGQDPGRNLVVYGNNGYFPRAFFVDGVVAAQDEEQALDLLSSADLRMNVILVKPPAGPRPGRMILPAEITRYRNREVAVNISNPVAGYLVLSDSYFPGWEATVDGKPARILLANYLVRAVALELGAHQVVFRYRPCSWRVGKTISLVSILFFPLLWPFRTKRPLL